MSQWQWRGALAVAMRQLDHDVAVESSSAGAVFAVEIVFHIRRPNYGRADLDNLAKPVLDTIFLPRRPQVPDLSLTGVLFRVDDDRVTRLTVEKRLVELADDEGADIVISWEYWDSAAVTDDLGAIAEFSDPES